MFTKELYTEIEIKAPATRVWQVLINFEAYPRWNPFVHSVAGDFRVGGRMDVQLESPGGRRNRFNTVVLVAEPNKELCWIGHFGPPGAFSGEHHFIIERELPDGVLFIQREVYRGFAVPFLARMLETDIRRGFELMNEALKAEAERSGSRSTG